MSITNNLVSSNPDHGEMYLIQHYVIKFVSDLPQASGFLLVFRFHPLLKADCHDITEILLKLAVSAINLTYCLSVANNFLLHRIVPITPHHE